MRRHAGPFSVTVNSKDVAEPTLERDRDAEIYERHADELVRFASGLVGPSDAADVVSAAVLRCITSKNWAHVTNHRAYMYRAVANEANSQYRSAMRRRAREIRTADRPVEQPEVRPEVLDAVGRLSVRQRAVVYLAYWEDLDETGISERLGISAGSVRRHLFRGREKLRELLA